MDKQQSIIEKIIQEIEKIRKSSPDDNYLAGGRAKLDEKISTFVSNSEKLILVLPSFPFKSQNRENTISDVADYGEYVALEVLNSVCENINMVYAPGVELVLASDGRLYSDLVGISDTCVANYREGVLAMNKRICTSSSIHWAGLDDLIKCDTTQDIRVALIEKYSDGLAIARDKIKADIDYQRLYIGFRNFALAELKAQNRVCSNRALLREAKAVSMNMMLRNFSNAKLLNKAYPKMIRLSVKHHDTTKGIFSINLLKVNTDIGTPWLNAIVRHRNNSLEYIKAGDARKTGYQLVTDRNSGSYYEEI